MLLLLVKILIGFLISSCDDNSNDSLVKKEIAKPVKTTVLNEPKEIRTRKYPGKVTANKDTELSFQVSGKLKEFNLEKGQEINKGEVVAKLDPVDYKLKYDEVKADKDEKHSILERTIKLYEKSYASESELDTAKAQFDAAEAKLSLAKQDIEYTILTAPFDGRIADTYVDNFQNIKAKEPIAMLHNQGVIDIAIDVPENIMIQIKNKEVLKRMAIFDAAPKNEYEVTFKDVVLQADSKTQTYEVYMTLETPEDINVLPGMTATVVFSFIDKKLGVKNNNDNIGNNEKENYLVPVTSVFTDENKNNYVWLVNKDYRLKKTRITIGELDNNMVLVTSGLKIGDTIVTAGVHLLRENQLVKNISDN